MTAPSNSKPSSFTRLLTKLDLWFEGVAKKAWKIAPSTTPNADRNFFLVDPGGDCNIVTSRDNSGQKLVIGPAVPLGAIFVGNGTEFQMLTPANPGDDGKALVYDHNVSGGWKLSVAAGGTGDVVGPAGATNHAVVLFDGTTGKLVKDGGVGTAGQVYTSNGPGAAPTFQPAGAIDADLAAIAALSGTGVPCRIAADTWALRNVAAADAKIVISNPAGIAGNITVGFGSVASTDLSNSANIALRNSSNSWSVAQLPSAAGTIDLGSTALPFRNLIFGGAATNNTVLASTTLTAQRTCTFPNANSNPVVPSTAGANQFANGISSGGVISYAQPAFSNLSGNATIAQGGTNNPSLGVLANGIMAGDGSKVIQVTGSALQSFRVNATGNGIEAYTPSGSGFIDNMVNGGRVTGTSGAPVSDTANATSIYFTPFKGNAIALYNGTTWNILTFSEITVPLTGLAAGVYDVFAYDNAGSVAVELLVWTNSTTRATAIVKQNGVDCKSGQTSRRLIATIRLTATGTTQDTVGQRLIVNVNNRVERILRARDTTNAAIYTTAVWQEYLAGSTPGVTRVETVIPLANEYSCSLKFTTGFFANNNASIASISIGANSSSAPSASSFVAASSINTSNDQMAVTTFLEENPSAVGACDYRALHRGNGSGNITWLGDNGTAEQFMQMSGYICG